MTGRVGRLLQRDADRARAVAGAKRRGTYSGKPVRFAPASAVKLCRCEPPWSSGEGYCIRCGKTLSSEQSFGRPA